MNLAAPTGHQSGPLGLELFTHAEADATRSPENAMGTVLITGVSGFVGGHLAYAARAEGHTVIGIDRASVAQPVDLLDLDGLRRVMAASKPDLVFHLGGALRAPDFRTLYEANVVGTANVLEAIADTKLSPRVVVASSSAVYGNPVADGLLTETSELRPLTHYGASKVAQEAVARRAFIATGLPVVIARSFNIVGPGQPSSLAAGAFAEQVARAERAGESSIKVGDLSGSRDFIDVRDVARGLLALGRAGVPGEAYNLSSGIPTTLQACVDALVSLAKVKLSAIYDPTRARANDARAQIGDRSRATHDTGWVPEVPFPQSMKELLDSWREILNQAGGTS